MDILLLALLAALGCSLRFHREPVDALDQKRMLPLRGVFALGILLHHSAQFASSETVLFQGLELYGGLFVSVFFAISGYALSVQYAQKGDRYLQGFLKKRIGTLLIPYALMTVLFLGLYAGFAAADGKSVGKCLMDQVYMTVIQGETLVPFSWFVEAIVYFYLLFYILNRGFHGRRAACCAGTLCGILIFMYALERIGYGDWWYNSSFAFLAGMLYFDLSESGALRRLPSGVLTLAVWGLFLAAWLALLHLGRWSHLWLHELACFLFPLALFLLLRNVRLEGRWLDYLGSRSYEIYLAQGVPFVLLYRFRAGNFGGLGWPLLYIAVSLLLGELLHRLDAALLGKLRRK